MLILASQSPRRRQLLQQLGVAFEVRKVDVPEVRQAGESAVGYVERVAREKGRAVLAELHDKPDVQVLSADTEVVLDDDVFGKPADAVAAGNMLRRLSGRTHEVVSAVWLLGHDREACTRCVSRVTFAALDADQIDAYVGTGEPFDKAGGYAIQGRAAAFVERLEGSYSGVMGLPLFETAQLLRQAGVDGAM
ncbi:MAG TPA: Maf family protein [Rhodanobacteraceae bacterium]